MTNMTPRRYMLPRSLLDALCSDCDPELGIFMTKNMVKLHPGFKQQKSVDYVIGIPRHPPLKDVSFMFQNRQPSAVVIPANKPDTYAEAITKGIRTTTTSQSP